MQAPIDIAEVDLVRRQGDVSGTLIYVAPNGQPANIGGWTFTFSIQPGSTLLTASWTPPIGNPSGLPISTVALGGFIVPGYNSSGTLPMISTIGITAGDFLYIPGAGILQAKNIVSGISLTVYNDGFPGNAATGLIVGGTNVWEASNMGYTVMTLPNTITDWNSGVALSPTRSNGRFAYFIKYTTTDPAPGPFKKTAFQGYLWIQPQNDPTA